MRNLSGETGNTVRFISVDLPFLSPPFIGFTVSSRQVVPRGRRPIRFRERRHSRRGHGSMVSGTACGPALVSDLSSYDPSMQYGARSARISPLTSRGRVSDPESRTHSYRPRPSGNNPLLSLANTTQFKTAQIPFGCTTKRGSRGQAPLHTPKAQTWLKFTTHMGVSRMSAK
jgi:hypothetical protein